MHRMSALQFTALSSWVVIATVWVCVCPSSVLAQPPPGNYNITGLELMDPSTFYSNDGQLSLTLSYDAFYYWGHTNTGRFWTRVYNDGIPGPLLRLKAGDTLFLHFQNNLGPNPLESEMNMSDPTMAGMMMGMGNMTHMPNTTNFHTHGLHVSPRAPSDSVFIAIDPGMSYDYVISLPSDHAPGTHWYHAHHHGSASLQVASGSSGPLIVDDPPGSLPAEYENMPEKVLHMNEFVNGGMGNIFAIAGEIGDKLCIKNPVRPKSSFILVNGYYRPKITMAAGKWHRFRLIWAATIGGLNCTVKPARCEMKLLAKDGVYLRDAPRDCSYVLMMPGNRADIAIRCDTVGSFTFISGIGGTVNIGSDNHMATRHLDIVTLNVVTNPDTFDDPLPPLNPQYPDYLADLTSVKLTDYPGQVETVSFQFLPTDMGCSINGALFRGQDYPNFRLNIGRIQQWTLNGVAFHPFHLHATHFQLMTIKHDYYRTGDWHDVFSPNGVYGAVNIRWQTDRFVGEHVVHCHIIIHEDMGCMGFALVQGEEGIPGPVVVNTAPSESPSSSRSSSPSRTASRSQTRSPSVSRTASPAVASQMTSVSMSPTPSSSVSRSASNSMSQTASPSTSASLSESASRSESRSLSSSASHSPQLEPSESPSSSKSRTPSTSLSSSESPSRTASTTSQPSSSASGSRSLAPSSTPSASSQPSESRSSSASKSKSKSTSATSSLSATPSSSTSVSRPPSSQVHEASVSATSTRSQFPTVSAVVASQPASASRSPSSSPSPMRLPVCVTGAAMPMAVVVRLGLNSVTACN